MKQDELLERLNLFEKDLDEFIALWKQLPKNVNNTNFKSTSKSINQSINVKSNYLLRQLGGLAPFINYFDNKYYKERLVFSFESCFKLYLKMSSPFHAILIETGDGDIFTLHSQQRLFNLETDIIPIISQIKGKLELMSPDDDFILDSSSDTPFVYLKESNNKIDINKDDLIIQYLDNLHPIIINSSKQLYLDRHYQNSIEEAIKAVNQHIRDKTGLREDGSDLINKVFSAKNPVLSFSDLSTETQQNEQVGFMEMLRGFVKGVRNVFAHTPAIVIDSQIAFEYLVMASLFCKRIDQTKKVSISEA